MSRTGTTGQEQEVTNRRGSSGDTNISGGKSPFLTGVEENVKLSAPQKREQMCRERRRVHQGITHTSKRRFCFSSKKKSSTNLRTKSGFSVLSITSVLPNYRWEMGERDREEVKEGTKDRREVENKEGMKSKRKRMGRGQRQKEGESKRVREKKENTKSNTTTIGIHRHFCD